MLRRSLSDGHEFLVDETFQRLLDVTLRRSRLLGYLTSRRTGIVAEVLDNLCLFLAESPCYAGYLFVGESWRHRVRTDIDDSTIVGVWVARVSSRCLRNVVLANRREYLLCGFRVGSDELSAGSTLLFAFLCLFYGRLSVEVEFGEQIKHEAVTRIDTAVDEPHRFVREVVTALLLSVVHRLDVVVHRVFEDVAEEVHYSHRGDSGA